MPATAFDLAPRDSRPFQPAPSPGPEDILSNLICPFDCQDEAMKELKEKAFKGKTVKTLQPAPGGEGMAVVEW